MTHVDRVRWYWVCERNVCVPRTLALYSKYFIAHFRHLFWRHTIKMSKKRPSPIIMAHILTVAALIYIMSYNANRGSDFRVVSPSLLFLFKNCWIKSSFSSQHWPIEPKLWALSIQFPFFFFFCWFWALKTYFSKRFASVLVIYSAHKLFCFHCAANFVRFDYFFLYESFLMFLNFSFIHSLGVRQFCQY